jgi:hypothetical protein
MCPMVIARDAFPTDAYPGQNDLPINTMDAVLAEHPFGDSKYITKEMHLACQRRLGKISRGLPVAGRLLEEISRADEYARYRIFGDTVVRCAIQHSHKQIESGLEYGLPLGECEEIFDRTIDLLKSGENAPIGINLGDTFSSTPDCGWIWREDQPHDIFSQSLKTLVMENFGEPLCTLTPDELTAFSKGITLLTELLPRLSSSALSHVHLVVFFAALANQTPSSSSEYRLSGSIYLSRRLLGSPWWVAEHVFHEALHQQLYDFRAGHSLLGTDAQRDDAPRICSLWNAPDSSRGNYWDIHRAVAAFHVYVHLALMATVVERLPKAEKDRLEAEYGQNRMVGARTACGRAQYLLEQIKLPVFWEELGPAGKRLVDWFADVLQAIDASPPPPGSYSHLLVDRYWREAREVEILLRQSQQPRSVIDQLNNLARMEAKEARSVFDVISGVDAEQYDNDLKVLQIGEPGMEFVATRDVIIRFLPKEYRFSKCMTADTLMRDMVEKASESLRLTLGR